MDDPAGAQTSGSATCPKGTVLLSGSVTSEGDTTSEYLTSAWPSSSRKFTAYQENASTSDQPFFVSALCAKKPPGYARVSVTQSLSAGGVADPSAYCPTGTSVIGGGVHVATPNPAVIISASTNPDSTSRWISVMLNSSAMTAKFTTYIICAA